MGVSVNNTSIELPPEIERLITGNDFWRLAKQNRYKKLIREGHSRSLLELAAIAATKDHPANWFARVCSVKQWERTLAFLAKLTKVRQAAVRVAQKLGVQVSKVIYRQVWSGANVERWADLAAEVGRRKGAYFNWLCRRELAGADGHVRRV